VQQPHVSIVIPTRHEGATIGPFLRQLRATLSATDFEVVVVDDSDCDNTVEVLLALRREFDPRQLVILHRPRGSVAERTLGTAVVTGARTARGTYVCVMDADGQHPPEAIPRMLAAARQTDADYVGGSRYMSGGSPRGLDGTSRKAISLGMALLTRLAFVLTPVRCVTDPLSGFFLFRRSLVDGVDLKPIGWKISLEVLIRGHASRVTEVPYIFASRTDGSSKASLKQGVLVLCHILTLLGHLTATVFGPMRAHELVFDSTATDSRQRERVVGIGPGKPTRHLQRVVGPGQLLIENVARECERVIGHVAVVKEAHQPVSDRRTTRHQSGTPGGYSR
jgi:dolichol-phosphate mannosyltransferase